MRDEDKTREQLIGELCDLRHKLRGPETKEISQSMPMEELLGSGEMPLTQATRLAKVEYQGISHDIKGDPRDKQKFPLEKEILEMVTQCAGVGLNIISKDYHLLWVNRILKQTYGEVQGEFCHLAYHKRATPCIECGVREVLETGKERVVIEQAMVDQTGNKVWLELIATPLKNKEGNIQAVFELIIPISKRKRAEEALLENEEKYRTLFEQSRDAIYITSSDGNLIDANQAMLELIGYSREEFMNLDLFKIYADPEDRLRLRQQLDEKGSLKDYYVKLKRKNGRQIYCLFTSSLIRAKDGSVLWHQGIIRDITERKQSEDSIRKAEERYRKLFEDAPVMYVINDHKKGDPVIQDCNNLFLINLGYSREEVLGRPLTDFYSPQSREIYLKENPYQKLLSGSFPPVERELMTRDGRIIETLAHVVPETDPDGSDFGARAMYVDITARNRAERELKVKTQMNALLLDSLPCIALLLKTGSREIVLSNRVGQNAGGSPGKPCFKTWPKRDTPCPWCLAPEAWVSGKTQNREVETPEGKAWDLYWIPLGPEQYVHYAFDITAHKRLEKQLIQSQKMEAIGQLAGGIAHDFNNLLSGITGYASLMKMKMDESNPFFPRLSIIEKSAWRAAELTKQLLGFAREGKYEVKEVDLNRVVNSVLGIITETFDRGIAIHTNLAQDIGPVEGDPGQLEQVLLNICLNARDAMPLGGRLMIETGNITLDEVFTTTHLGARKGEHVLLTIRDTGGGIPPEIQGKIFEPFFTTKERGKGTGMGLAMVYGIIKNHEGYISVYSEPGRGTCFKIYLPVTKNAFREKIKSSKQSIPMGSGTILLVDDEETVRELGKTILEELGYQVILAADGLEGCAVFSERWRQIDLVLLDMSMPGMGGKEIFKKLRKINNRIRVLFCSGYTMNKQALDIMKEGAQGFVPKPFNVEQLANSVSAALSPAKDWVI